MKVLFVTYDGISHEPLGLEYVSGALLGAGHTTRACQESQVVGESLGWKPDFVAFQVITGDQDRWGAVALKVKAACPWVKTIFGGPHFLFFTDAKQVGADIVIRGEAEKAIVEAVEGRKWDDLFSELNLDLLAKPDRALLYNRRFPAIRDNVIRNFIAVRGCPYKCFLSGTQVLLYNKGYRSIEDIVIGDGLVSVDVESGRVVKGVVVERGSRWAEDVYRVELSDGTVFGVTGEHPFWTRGGWKVVCELRVGDEVRKVSVGRGEEKDFLEQVGGEESREAFVSQEEDFENIEEKARQKTIGVLEEVASRRENQTLDEEDKSRGLSKDLIEQVGRQESDETSRGSKKARTYVESGLSVRTNSVAEVEVCERSGVELEADICSLGVVGSARWEQGVLDRSVSFGQEEKSRFCEYQEEVSSVVQFSSLAQSGGCEDSEKGLFGRGVVGVGVMGWGRKGSEPSKSEEDGERVPGEWICVRRVTLLGGGLVFNITVAPSETFVAGGILVHNCTYCYNSNEQWQKMTDRKMRYHSPEWLVEDIRRTFLEYGGELVSFQDDIFGVDMSWLEHFVEVYQKIRIPFFAQMRPHLITEDRVKLLKRAGVHIVSFAIESGNEKTRSEVLDRKESNALIENGCRLLHRYGIKFRMQNLLGLPVDDPLEDALETVRFNIAMKPTLSWTSLLQAYPGTKIAEYVIKKGLVKNMEELMPKVDATFFEESSLPIKNKRQIERLQKWWSAVVRWPWMYPLVRVLIYLRLGWRFERWVFNVSKNYINKQEYWRIEGRGSVVGNRQQLLDRLGGELSREAQESCEY